MSQGSCTSSGKLRTVGETPSYIVVPSFLDFTRACLHSPKACWADQELTNMGVSTRSWDRGVREVLTAGAKVGFLVECEGMLPRSRRPISQGSI